MKDLGDSLCWWQDSDNDDGFQMSTTYFRWKAHQHHKTYTIVKSPTYCYHQFHCHHKTWSPLSWPQPRDSTLINHQRSPISFNHVSPPDFLFLLSGFWDVCKYGSKYGCGMLIIFIHLPFETSRSRCLLAPQQEEVKRKNF